MSSTPRPYKRWQHFLSYLTDVSLASVEGDHTDHLEVVLRKGKVLLQANGAVYSWEDNYYNFVHAFNQLNWNKLSGEQCLLLGLGLGSVPQLIEERHNRRLQYTCIEYDETVVALAEKYLLYRLTSPCEVIVADAERYVELCRDRFHLIVLDLFVDDKVPAQFDTTSFLKQVRALMAPGGVVISNRLTYTQADKRAAKRYYDTVYSEVFPNAAYLDVATNWMLFSDGSYLRDPALD